MDEKEKFKFNLTGPEAAARRKVTRIQILQGDAECFRSKDPVLLAGEWAYERDTGKIKIGDGISSWNNVPYKIDQTLDNDMVTTIQQAKNFFITKGEPGGYASLGPDGKIVKSQLPDEIKSTTVVRTISDMEKIPAADRYMGLFVFVLDASADETVGSGAATYIWTSEKWEKVSEAESMEIDQSDFLLKSKDTLDDILSGEKYVHFTKEDREKLESIEKDATGDLSAQEIAGMYEGLQDVNRLTDELKQKIESIETGATNDTPEKLIEKIKTVTSSQRLDADNIQSGKENRFFTEKERKEIDDISVKLQTIENGATKDTPEQLRDKLQSLNIDKLISADYIKNGATHKFLTPAHLESIKLIGSITEEIENLKDQAATVDEAKIKEISESKIKEISNKLENFKTEINKTINQKLNKVEIDLGSNTVNITNLGDIITQIQNQISNINESWVKDISDTKIKEVVSNLENFKTEINRTINQKLNKVEVDSGNTAVNLTNIEDAIDRIQSQLVNINESWVRDISDKKTQELVGNLDNFKNEINRSINQKLNKFEIDLGSNSINLENLGDTITRIQNQITNINESWVKDISDAKIQEILAKLENFKTEINRNINQKFNKYEIDLGNNTINIENLAGTIALIQNQLANIDESWVRNISKDLVGDLNDFKIEINRSINQKFTQFEVNLGNNTINLTNLGDTVALIQNQMANIDESWVRSIYDTRIQELVGNINNFKTEINNNINNRLNKFETNFGDISLNLKNEFISNINQRLESEIVRLEDVFQTQIDSFRTFLTPEQIKVLYESNPDTNIFTDKEKVKLAGIMPNADVTNYETVKTAGAVMEGDILFGGDCATMF
jgi:hypothetical protein